MSRDVFLLAVSGHWLSGKNPLGYFIDANGPDGIDERFYVDSVADVDDLISVLTSVREDMVAKESEVREEQPELYYHDRREWEVHGKPISSLPSPNLTPDENGEICCPSCGRMVSERDFGRADICKACERGLT